jgi:hypothetical protein
MEGNHVDAHVEVIASPPKIWENIWSQNNPKEDHNIKVQTSSNLCIHHGCSLPLRSVSCLDGCIDTEGREEHAPMCKVIEKPQWFIGQKGVVDHHNRWNKQQISDEL